MAGAVSRGGGAGNYGNRGGGGGGGGPGPSGNGNGRNGKFNLPDITGKFDRFCAWCSHVIVDAALEKSKRCTNPNRATQLPIPYGVRRFDGLIRCKKCFVIGHTSFAFCEVCGRQTTASDRLDVELDFPFDDDDDDDEDPPFSVFVSRARRPRRQNARSSRDGEDGSSGSGSGGGSGSSGSGSSGSGSSGSGSSGSGSSGSGLSGSGNSEAMGPPTSKKPKAS